MYKLFKFSVFQGLNQEKNLKQPGLQGQLQAQFFFDLNIFNIAYVNHSFMSVCFTFLLIYLQYFLYKYLASITWSQAIDLSACQPRRFFQTSIVAYAQSQIGTAKQFNIYDDTKEMKLKKIIQPWRGKHRAKKSLSKTYKTKNKIIQNPQIFCSSMKPFKIYSFGLLLAIYNHKNGQLSYNYSTANAIADNRISASGHGPNLMNDKMLDIQSLQIYYFPAIDCQMSIWQLYKVRTELGIKCNLAQFSKDYENKLLGNQTKSSLEWSVKQDYSFSPLTKPLSYGYFSPIINTAYLNLDLLQNLYLCGYPLKYKHIEDANAKVIHLVFKRCQYKIDKDKDNKTIIYLDITNYQNGHWMQIGQRYWSGLSGSHIFALLFGTFVPIGLINNVGPGICPPYQNRYFLKGRIFDNNFLQDLMDLEKRIDQRLKQKSCQIRFNCSNYSDIRRD